MADMFTLSFTHDRDMIMAEAKNIFTDGGNLSEVKEYLNLVYVGWSHDIRTACMIELLCRENDDPIGLMFKERLDALNKSVEQVS